MPRKPFNPSSGGVFDPAADYLITGSWVFRLAPDLEGTISGLVRATRAALIEPAGTALSGRCTVTVPLPGQATIHDIQVDQGALWAANTAALKIGDSEDDDGYFVGVNMKATDLLPGEQLSLRSSETWGGKQGAYLVAATGRRGPAGPNNFGGYVGVSGTKLIATVDLGRLSVTPTGKTLITVLWSLGDAIDTVNVAPVLSR